MTNMKNTLKFWIIMVMAALSLALTSCENYPEGVPSFYSSEYRIVGTWQVSHVYLNGEEVDSTGYAAYEVGTYYFMYPDHVMSVKAYRNGEWRETIFANYILDPKTKTIDMSFTLMDKNYTILGDVKRLSRKEFFFEFDDPYGDHWRLELFSRSSY
jgi:hypothetical protein